VRLANLINKICKIFTYQSLELHEYWARELDQGLIFGVLVIIDRVISDQLEIDILVRGSRGEGRTREWEPGKKKWEFIPATLTCAACRTLHYRNSARRLRVSRRPQTQKQ
jgi:hypothetical protein